jgi:hypothetical protein
MQSTKKHYQQWDTAEVGEWLTNVVKLPQYSKQFEDIGVDGQIIDHITDTDLEGDFAIKVRLHRVKIIEGIKKLQQDGSSGNPVLLPAVSSSSQQAVEMQVESMP